MSADLRLPGRVLVTGGAGFLGSHLVRLLLSQNYSVFVRILDIGLTDPTVRRLKALGIDVVLGDVRDLEILRFALRDIDTVFHAAAVTDPMDAGIMDVNVLGTKNIIQAILESEDCEQLIYTSSSAVVLDGKDVRGAAEKELDYPSRFMDGYCKSKAMAEKLVLAANGRRKTNGEVLRSCAIRPHTVFGPGDTHFMAQLIAKARSGSVTHMIGEGNNIVDFTYVENVAWAHLLAAQNLRVDSPVCGNAYFITNGEPQEFWTFIRRLLLKLGCVGPTKYISFRLAYMLAYIMEIARRILAWIFPWINFRPTITRRMVCNMARHQFFSHDLATKDFGYRPIVSLDKGVEHTVEFFSRQRAVGLLELPILGNSSHHPEISKSVFPDEDAEFSSNAFPAAMQMIEDSELQSDEEYLPLSPTKS